MRRPLLESAGVRLVFVFFALAWGWFIFDVMSRPGVGGASTLLWSFAVNGGHAAVFAMLGFLLGMGLPRDRRWTILALVLASTYGAFTEWYQGRVPFRTADPYDWMTDTAGAALGLAVIGFLSWRGLVGVERQWLIVRSLGLAALCLLGTSLATFA